MKRFFTFPILFLFAFVISASGFAYKYSGSKKRQEDKPITLEEYNKLVAGNKAVLVYFHADWCMICKKMNPVIMQVEKDFAGRILVLRINTERDTEVANEFEINALPLLILYRNGEKQWTRFGLKEKSMLEAEISECL